MPRSRGFEAMAGSADGRRLYPIVEGALTNDPEKRRRVISEFDTRKKRYTARTWAYQTDTDANVVGDAYMTGKYTSCCVIERDDFEGAAAVTKRVYAIDLRTNRPRRLLAKTLVVDLLKIANPAAIGVGRSPGAYGVGRDLLVPLPVGRDRGPAAPTASC